GRFSLEKGHAQARSVLHSPQNLILAALADEAVVLARLGEAQKGEVADEDEHEDDGNVVGHRDDRPEVLQRTHASSARDFRVLSAASGGQLGARTKDAANRRTGISAP